MKELKFQKLDSKNRKKYIGIAVIVVLVIGVIFYITGKTHSTGSDDLLGNKMIDGLSFENASLDFKDGVTTIEVEVYNESGNHYNLKTIDVKIIDKNNQEVIIPGYIGETIDENEGKLLKVSINEDLTGSKSMTYIINK